MHSDTRDLPSAGPDGSRARSRGQWYCLAQLRTDRRLTDPMRMRLKLLQDLCREHAVATACENGEIIYRNVLPPVAWLNHHLERLGLTWRLRDVEGNRCTFVDRDTLPVSAMISTQQRQQDHQSGDGATISG